MKLKFCCILFSCLITLSSGYFTSESVIFQKTNEVFTNDAQWYVTFVHDLRPFQGLISKIKHDLGHTNEIISVIKNDYSKSKLLGYAETFTSLQLEVDFLTDTYQAIYNTFENYQILHSNRGKRSLLPFVGQLMSSLFGTISEHDLENIDRNIDILSDNQDKIIHDLDVSLSILNMTRMQVSENRRSIIDLIVCVQKLDRKILELQNSIEGKFTRLEQFIHTYLQFRMIFDEIKLTVQNAIFYLENLKSELNMLSLNHLSVDTISPYNLKTLLMDIQSMLPNNYELSRNPADDIWYFYKVLTCMTYLENNQIRIVVKIPLIDTREKYEVFKVHNIPFSFHHSSKQYLAKYELESDRLMVSKNRESYTLLSEDDFQMCNNLKLQFCNPKTLFYPTNMNKLCVMALFLQSSNDIKHFCKHSVLINQELPAAEYLSNGIWIVITNENLQFTITCQSSMKQTTNVDVKPPFSMIQVNNDCKASNKYMRLPRHFDKNSRFNRSDSLQSLLKLRNISHFIIGRTMQENFSNLTTLEIPSHLSNLKEIPLQTFVHEVTRLRKVNSETKSFWKFTNIAIILLFVMSGCAIVLFILKSKYRSSHSFCLRRKVNEHETELTVLKLPTNDVESTTKGQRKSVTLLSDGANDTFKDQNFLGQTDACMAWPKTVSQSM